MLVGVSGGADSITLLHLLRFTPGLPELDLQVVHVDHGWRGGSRSDAHWVRGVGRAWRVPVTVQRLPDPDQSGGAKRHSETLARELRFAVLERERARLGATHIALAHHADDQAETVLHRMARGTGPGGLAAMSEFRRGGVWRPLLGYWRSELRSYAKQRGLSWRPDPTNRDLARPRNLIRHKVLPTLEEGVSKTTRRALVRLAALASDEVRAWDSALALIEEQLDLRVVSNPDLVGRTSASVASAGLRALDRPLRSRVLRRIAARLSCPLDRAGTEIAARFSIAEGHGRVVDLTGGLRLRRDQDRVILIPPVRSNVKTLANHSPG